jgi:hypothetical protein
VIGQDDGGETGLPTSTSDLDRWHSAIKRSRAVDVEINTDLGLRSCLPPLPDLPLPRLRGRVGEASGHVGYYKRRHRVLRRRCETGVYQEGWPLTGKERLNSRKKLSPWN